MELVERAWAGIDAGKGHHHVVVIDGEGRRMLSRRVANDEPDLETLIAAIVDCATEVNWTIDLADGPAALVLALLLGRGQRVWYLPGVAVNPRVRWVPRRGQDRRERRGGHRRPGPHAPRPA